MNHASLFSGIGGFDLASQWMGWNNIFQVEKDEWCQSILTRHFPLTERYLDIKEFNGEKYRGSIDIISGGFPCQPFSVAGKQKGTEDDRYLWPEMLRVIREIQPTWVVGENVPGIVSLALDQVCTDLENEGYTVQAFIIPAASVNAIHKRDRVWILANRTGLGHSRGGTHENGKSQERSFCENIGNNGNGIRVEAATSDSSIANRPNTGIKKMREWSIGSDSSHANSRLSKQPKIKIRAGGHPANSRNPFIADTEHDGPLTTENGGSIGNHARTGKERANELQQLTGTGFVSNTASEQSQSDDVREDRTKEQIKLGRRDFQKSRLTWPVSQPTICRGDDGVSYRLDDGRLITAKQRTNALKGLGNAVVPQVVYEIFRMIGKENERT